MKNERPIGRDAINTHARAAFAVAAANDWRSHDPFDLLLSPLTKPAQRSLVASRLIVQIGKRRGRLLRRLLRVPTHAEAKAAADFLRAAVLLDGAGNPTFASTIEPLEQLLADLSSETATGRGWGLNFPYASRFGRLPRGAPNIYTTVNVCHALLDSQRGEKPPDLVRSACAFICDELDGLRFGDRSWFRYSPGAHAPIINIQASAAGLLARVAAATDDDRLESRSRAAAATVVASQRSDGSWPYSADGSADFVDGFHTGFVLEGLKEYSDAIGGDESARAASTVGFAFFKRRLMTATGAPRLFADGRPSDDVQNAAQCVQTLLRCGSESDVATARSVWEQQLLPVFERLPERLRLRWEVGPAVLATAYLAQSLVEPDA